MPGAEVAHVPYWALHGYAHAKTYIELKAELSHGPGRGLHRKGYLGIQAVGHMSAAAQRRECVW